MKQSLIKYSQYSARTWVDLGLVDVTVRLPEAVGRRKFNKNVIDILTGALKAFLSRTRP